MTRISRMLCLLIAFFVAIPLCAESKNPADYPLRLHIFVSNEVTFYHNRSVDETRGDGRANLFENGEPRGVDFSFDCDKKVKPSFGFETYPAKWKKQGERLIVLLPVFGEANAYFSCTLHTQVREFAYFMRNGKLASEPPAQYKAWMANHDYDPEHGKNTPRAADAAAPLGPLDEARQFLTCSHKDAEKAKKLLLEIVQDNKTADAETLMWANIYLGYLEDRAKNRQNAIGWYEKALKVEGAPPGSVRVAKSGLQQPLTWIRHLDAPNQQPVRPPSGE